MDGSSPSTPESLDRMNLNSPSPGVPLPVSAAAGSASSVTLDIRMGQDLLDSLRTPPPPPSSDPVFISDDELESPADNSDTSTELASLPPFGDYGFNSVANQATGSAGKGECQVCNDVGSGNHYGILTCEGCKGFFKRTVQLALYPGYKCRSLEQQTSFLEGEGEVRCCDINKHTRNWCQKCRYEKCIRAGMCVSLVRKDHMPGGAKRVRVDATELPAAAAAQSGQPTAPPPPPPPKLTEEMVEHLQALTSIGACHIPEDPPGLATPITPDNLPTASDIMQSGYMELRMIIHWARRVPGFCALLIEDQMSLLKSCFMDLNIFRLSFRSYQEGGNFRYTRSISLSSEDARRAGFIDSMVRVCDKFLAQIRALELDMTEFCCLCAILLFFGDAKGLVNKSQVQEAQNKVMSAMSCYIKVTYSTQPTRYVKIVRLLSGIRGVANKVMDGYLTMALEGSIPMDELVTEFIAQ